MRHRRRAVLALALAALLVATAAAAPAVTVTVRGTEVSWTDAVPYLDGGRTMVPVRAASEAMGLEVRWDAAARRIDLSRTYTSDGSPYRAELQSGQWEYLAQRTMRLWIGQGTYEVVNEYAVQDGRTVTASRTGEHTGELDAAPVIRGGRSYVPIRHVAEQFGFDVLWDGAARTVRIVSALSADWSYAWSIDPGEPGSLVLALHTPVNVASAEITSVTVTAAGGRAETLDLQAAGADDEARIRETVGADAVLLDAVRGAHAFQAGASYTIGFTAVLAKANGAQETVTDTFQVQLPAA